MKKITLGIVLVSLAYTHLCQATEITFINRVKDDLVVNYIICDKDHFCADEEPITIASSSYKIIEDVDSEFFSYIKARKAFSKNTNKKGKFSADGVCEVSLNINGFLIFDDYNTNKIICTRG